MLVGEGVEPSLSCILLPQRQAPQTPRHEEEEELKKATSKRLRFEKFEPTSPLSPPLGPELNGGELLRSPTPYPKELRKLANSARNFNKQQQQRESYKSYDNVDLEANVQVN